MKENFLHYIWQYQLFNKTDLLSTVGEKIFIEKLGIYTQNSGPDFINSKIKINEQLWVGTVEIHLKSSDWYVHNHENDAAFDNVILHVVWEDDMPVYRKTNTPVSTLELKGRVSLHLLQQYNQLFNTKQKWIACENNVSDVNTFIWNHWLERLFIERLHDKSLFINELLKKTNNDWETVLFILLAKNFGLKLNSQPFFLMASALEYSVVKKESKSAGHLEALFMGLTGVLNPNTTDSYEKELNQIFAYLRHKYQLTEIYHKAQFFRLRPPNFPTIRLSQLANLLFKNQLLFQELMRIQTLDEFYNLLQSQTSEYWETHFIFGKENKKNIKKTTPAFVDLLLINTIIPLKFAYQNYMGKPDIESLIVILKQLNPEKNSIIEHYTKIKVPIENSLHTQALLTLKNKYCDFQKCLECEIGLHILKGKNVQHP
jgi:hypothetical protein